MENKINAVLDAATQTKVNASIESVKTDLPFLIELSSTDAKRIIYMESGRIDFVRRALFLANNNPKIQPQFFEMVDFEKDITLAQSLDEIISKTTILLKMLNDTRNQAGHEAFQAALEVYNISKRGAAKGIEGAQTTYDELKSLFEGQGKSAKPNETNKP